MTPSRRSFITGLAASIITAPAIVRAASLMPVKVVPLSNSEQMLALLAERIAAAEALTTQWMTTYFYGTETNPFSFTGFAPLINADGEFSCRQSGVQISLGALHDDH